MELRHKPSIAVEGGSHFTRWVQQNKWLISDEKNYTRLSN
jgi:hypothetical protein